MEVPIVRGYGNVASSSNSNPVTANTAFMQASISKVFAAAAVSILLDRGLIDSLDDDICNVIPITWDQSTCRNPRYPNVKITWRMLVTHRSSLRNDIQSVRNQNNRLVAASYGPSGGYGGEAAGNPTCPLSDVTGFYQDFLTDKETETTVGSKMKISGGGRINWHSVGKSKGGVWQRYQPGEKSEYSNLAVGYIAALVEFVTKESFSNFSRDNIFDPLGMENTAWFREDLPSGTRQAIPVEYLGGGDRFNDIGHYCFIDYASGQLYTTANDMSKWALAMLNNGVPQLWSEGVGELLFQCQERNTKGQLPKECEVGMGWYRLDNSMKSQAESYMNAFKKYDWTNGGVHDGAECGSQTHLIVLPAAGVFTSVMTNTDLNDEYAPQKMCATLAQVNIPPNISPVNTPTIALVKPTTTVPVIKPTTTAPITPEPTTLSPVTPEPITTLAPITPEPTTLSLVTFEPTTLAPITFEPTTVAPINTQVPTTAMPTRMIVIPDTPVNSSPILCFSSHSTIHVLHRGYTHMKDLCIGDYVLTEHNTYEPIYAFGHYSSTTQGNFIQLLPFGLELSSDHLVFIEEKGFIPASNVQIGDVVRIISEEGIIQQQQVTAIQHVTRKGVYAPFTASGTIVVNQVLASCYVTLQPNSNVLRLFGKNRMSMGIHHHDLAHAITFPLRLLLLHLLPSQQQQEVKEGISYWVVGPMELFQWLLSSSSIVLQILFLIPIVQFLICLSFLERYYTIIVTIIIVVLLLKIRRKKKSWSYHY